MCILSGGRPARPAQARTVGAARKFAKRAGAGALTFSRQDGQTLVRVRECVQDFVRMSVRECAVCWILWLVSFFL